MKRSNRARTRVRAKGLYRRMIDFFSLDDFFYLEKNHARGEIIDGQGWWNLDDISRADIAVYGGVLIRNRFGEAGVEVPIPDGLYRLVRISSETPFDAGVDVDQTDGVVFREHATPDGPAFTTERPPTLNEMNESWRIHP